MSSFEAMLVPILLCSLLCYLLFIVSSAAVSDKGVVVLGKAGASVDVGVKVVVSLSIPSMLSTAFDITMPCSFFFSICFFFPSFSLCNIPMQIEFVMPLRRRRFFPACLFEAINLTGEPLMPHQYFSIEH